MYLAGYSARIPQGREDSQGYVRIKHGKNYKLILANKNNVRCEAEVFIDGKHQGTWILNAHQTIELERPVYDNGKFTFYQINSKEAKKAGLVSANELGLITVNFIPEKARPSSVMTITQNPITWAWPNTSGSSSFQPNWESKLTKTSCPARSMGTTFDSNSVIGSVTGGTGLEGHSDQNFITVDGFETNEDKTVSIHLRLIAEVEEKNIRPLGRVSNPIPPRLY